MRVLALSPVPERGAGCRFRVAQYRAHLEASGFELTIQPFFDDPFFAIVYEGGLRARKAAHFLRRAVDRARTVLSRRDYDLFFIYREAFPIGPPLIEALLGTSGRPMVYDFDDAVFLPNVSEANRSVGALKYPQKVGQIIRRCAHVIAGNDFLAAFARAHNPAVTVIPTCVDTDLFAPAATATRPVPRLGWIGTPTTVPYLAVLRPILAELAQASRFTLRVCGAGAPFDAPGVAVEHDRWMLEREVELFNTCDVGVYPLDDDDWGRGKCGFKAIQFMACGVPVVAAPVGVNREIIQDGVNGFLAATRDEWVRKLRRLIEDPDLRRDMGRRARATIVARYSLAVNGPRLASALTQVVGRADASAAG